MVYTPEQVVEVKKQIVEQTKHLPVEQQAQIKEQLEKMSPEQLELFVQQQQAGQQQSQENKKGIFRMIVDGDVPSKKIDENKDAIVVVSVRAVSKGHCLVLPKKPVGDANLMPASVFTLAKSVAKKIGSKLKAKSTEIQSESAFGEVVVNVIPVYDNPVNLSSQRYEVKEGELEEVWKKLRVVKKPKVERIKIKKKKATKVLKLRRRVP
jgi:diadenosine tetraphosphate (Ap4A) HIT family hydrolase